MTPALRLEHIRKAYGATVAVEDVSLELFPGEIHALVGENGAGKSTLAGIAFGEISADAGEIIAQGSVGLVHQHFELAGRLRVWENILLGREPRMGWRLDRTQAIRRVTQLAAEHGFEIDPLAFVDDLPVGIQQRVELLRELERKPAVLLLDEPTAALAPAEIDAFFASIVQIAAQGTAILIVTHKLQEVISNTKRVTVMRHGRVVAQMVTAQANLAQIAHAMIGGEVPALAVRTETAPAPCLNVCNLHAAENEARVDGLSLDVHAGEILGIAGVEGNGQSALADAVCGMLAYRGEISFSKDARPDRRSSIPQDRLREAVVLGWTITQNVLLGRQRRTAIARHGWLNETQARASAKRVIAEFDVRCTSEQTRMNELSGGNQQKVVVGRALIDDPRFVLAYNPTRGVDVGAATLVQSRLIEARNRGAAVLLISFDLDEILQLADRVLVIYRGGIVGEMQGLDIDRERIGRLMAGLA